MVAIEWSYNIGFGGVKKEKSHNIGHFDQFLSKSKMSCFGTVDSTHVVCCGALYHVLLWDLA
jgi:hypothetical protein